MAISIVGREKNNELSNKKSNGIMTQKTTTAFIPPSEVQSTFFKSLSADAHEFYANIFVSLRPGNRQWLALALYNWHKHGIWPAVNRNPFMQSLFTAIADAEDCAAFEEDCAKLGAVHEASLDNLSTRLKKWFRDKLTLTIHKK